MTVRPLALMTAASALTGAEIFYAQQAGADVKVKASQIARPLNSAWVDGGLYMAADGVTDDTAGMQAAVAAATLGTLFLPKGVIVISNSIVITNQIHIIGAGSSQASNTATTTLLWRGTSAIPMLDLQGIVGAVFEDFLIQSDAAAFLAAGIRSQSISGRSSGLNSFLRIYMNGTTAYLGKGWQYAPGTGGDVNNDENFFDHCFVNNFTIAGWSFEHSQSRLHKLISCSYYGRNNAGTAGVTTTLGTSNQGGSFTYIAGTGGNVDVDFILGGANDPILISGSSFEGSGRLLTTINQGGNSWPITISGVSWAGDTLNADGKAIIYQGQGPLNIIGSYLNSGGFTAKACQFLINGFYPISGIAIGNSVGSSLAQPFVGTSFTGASPWVLIGNTINIGPATFITNSFPGSINQTYSTNASTSASTVLTAADIPIGVNEHTLNLTGAITVASNAQLPAVLDLIAAIVPSVGQTCKLRIINGGGTGSGVWTITTNTGWTLNGTMTLASAKGYRDFYITLTSLTTATLQSLGGGTITAI